MSETIENFEVYLKEKNIPLKKSQLKNGQILFNGNFRLTKTRVLPFGIVFDSKDAKSIDFQITYHKLAYVKDFTKKAEILELLNELNQVKAGYYSVILAGDGEIYLKQLSRTTSDVLAAYEMIVFGSTIAKVIIKEIEKVLEPAAAE